MADKKPELDAAQKAAVSVNINAVVSAGAGSGKTSVLSKRFTDILLRDKACTVEQILTLTFTKKATVEMNGRIYKELAAACPEKAKDFFKANIKTLDSYCSQVARSGCHYYGVSPDFTIDDNKINAAVEKMALPFILKHRDNFAIKALVATKDYSEIAKQLFVDTVLGNSTVAETIDFENTLKCQKEFMKNIWDTQTKIICNLKNDLDKEIEMFAGNRGSATMQCIIENSSRPVPDIPELNFEEYVSEEREKFLEYFAGLRSKTPGNVKGSAGIKEKQEEIFECFTSLLSVENFVYGLQFVIALVPLLEEFQRMVNETKRKTGMLTYSDASSLALRILIDHPELRKLEKEKYRYIMIDEFQDNNAMQRDLLFLLAEKKDRMEKSVPQVEELEEDKLFFVGDEKQSIYRFRGADVSVFRSLSDDFKKGNMELKTNYRSHPALISSFNTLFGGLNYPLSKKTESGNSHLPCVFYTEEDQKSLKEKNENVPEYEAVYHEVQIPEHKLSEIKASDEKKVYSPRVHFAVYDSDQNADDESYTKAKAECRYVARKIKDILENGIDGKRYNANDIAVLFRTYTRLPEYEKVFLNEGIPYVSETVKGFFADGPVNDIVSFLRLVSYPGDKLSFMNILRSPFVNLSSSETESILSLESNGTELFTADPSEILSEESLLKFNNAKELFNRIKELSKKSTISELISELWYKTGYSYETLWNKSVYMYASSYDRLFELARQADLEAAGLAEFVDSLDTYQSESEKLDGMEIPQESSDGVKIMSIHKSKGLEFKVVFVCDCGNEGLKDKNDKVSYVSRDYGLTINTPESPSIKLAQKPVPSTVRVSKLNYFYEMQKTIEEKMKSAELRRVAYVALTRAEEYLFVTGCQKISSILSGNDYLPGGKKCPKSIIMTLSPCLRENLLPCSIINADGTASFDVTQMTEGAFTFEIIEPSEKDVKNNLSETKQSKIKKIESLYDKAAVIEKEEVKSQYISPSHLHKEDDETKTGKQEIRVNDKIPYSVIDRLVHDSVAEESRGPEFKYSDFGTIAHAYMEFAVKDEVPHMLNKEVAGLRGDEKKIALVDEVCRKMQETFLSSENGRKVMASKACDKFYRSEFSFRSLVAGKIINGQIDLVFENPDDDGYTILDFKTNQEIDESLYVNQLACYRQAISNMLDINPSKIRCVLHYLRYGKDADITEKCNLVNLEDVISSIV